MNLALLLDMAAEAFGARCAASCEGRSLSFADLQRLVRAFAHRVREHGARTVAHLDVNGLAAPVALYAAARTGVTYVPLNYRLARAEIEALLERLEAPLLVASARQVAGLRVPAGTAVVESEALLSAGTANGDDGLESVPDTDPDAVALQLFTSGTTGAPKAAVLRHGHLAAYVLGSVEFGGAAASEATLVAVPPYHVAGIAAILTSTYAGRRIVVLPDFEATTWLGLARAERVTQAFLVPTMLARIVERLDATGAEPPPALRAIAYGGGTMPRAVIERAMRFFGEVDFTNAYGLTETSSTICLLGPEEHRAAAASAERAIRARLQSVGRPLPGVEIEVRDERGRLLEAGQRGLVFVRGAQVSGEYRDTGSQLDAGGWFATRDQGWVDHDGYVFLDGRADDVIVRGGENISPGEIEAVLRMHPAVADAAVVAVASEEWGEAVGAIVVLRDAQAASAADLQQWVCEHLRGSRVPERVVFRDKLPYNDMGKLLRRDLRRELRDGP
jgi:long-chain acyl-CoA synthetase